MDDASGLMVLHVWVEPGNRARLRLTSTVDVTSEVSTTSYVATQSEALALVQTWLDAVVARAVTHP